MQDFGALLRQFRRERGLSQLQLALRAVISSRHLSFLETGRARPSEEMISRLATALNVESGGIDDLRTTAGFCPKYPCQTFSLGDRIFESALAMEAAQDVAQIIEAGQAVLPLLGISQFFFGTLSGEVDGKFAFDWANFGAFPESWLKSYDRERYAMTDPLLTIARERSQGFYWDDVIDRRSLTRPAREMFDRAEAGGISCGFVHLQRFRGSTRIVSMMGNRMDRRDHRARVGLDILGSRMLTALHRVGALRSALPAG